jgi:hypothetical protein
VITWETDNETVRTLLAGYLTQRHDHDYQKTADVLERGKCQLSWAGGARLSKKQERGVPEGPIRDGCFRFDRGWSGGENAPGPARGTLAVGR